MTVRFLEAFKIETKKDFTPEFWKKSTYQIKESKFTILRSNN